MNLKTYDSIYADAYLTPFSYSYNSKFDKYCPIVIADYPNLLKLEDLAYNLDLQDVKTMFKRYIEELENENFSFNYELVMKDKLLNHRLNYTCEVLKQCCHSSKKIAFVTNHQYIEPLIESWKKLKPEINNFNSFYKDNIRDLNFVDFMEKLVILDILEGSFINSNFIVHQTFPYGCRRNPSWETGFMNLFQIWNNYYKHYSEMITNVPFKIDKYNKYLSEFNILTDNREEAESQDLYEEQIKKQFHEEINKFDDLGADEDNKKNI